MSRSQENWAEAIRQYELALEFKSDDWQKARIHNNLGYALHLLGRSELAFSHCKIALRIRKKLENAYELGLSYNTLGILYVDALHIPEAEASFQEAILHFHQAHSARGRALVHTALGRLYRQWGWYEERVVGKPFDTNRDKYKKSLEYLRDAIDIFAG